eukprot:3273914-Amphidinium_carterae.1
MSALTRTDKRHEHDALASNFRQPPPLERSVLAPLRTLFQERYYELDEDVVPASTLLENLFEQVGDNELKATQLKDLLSSEDVSDEVQSITLDRTGQLQVKKQTQTVSLPRTSEELRRRLGA